MTAGLDRRCTLAGTWYPHTLEEAESYWTPAPQRRTAKAALCPHAGWMYSGRVAGAVYGALTPPDTVICLAPNHTGRGRCDTSLYPRGRWILPERVITIDAALAGELLSSSEYLAEDPDAHTGEHAIEVQVPFLALLNPRVTLVPILMRDYAEDICQDLGRAMANVVRRHPERSILLLASSDMTHYEPQAEAERKDREAIDALLALDPERLRRVVHQRGISMCGMGPASAVWIAARALGAKTSSLAAYATSADVTGDPSSVVGYAGLLVW